MRLQRKATTTCCADSISDAPNNENALALHHESGDELSDDDSSAALVEDESGDEPSGDDSGPAPSGNISSRLPTRHRRPPVDFSDANAQMRDRHQRAARAAAKLARKAYHAVYNKAVAIDGFTAKAAKTDPSVPKSDADLDALPPDKRDAWLQSDEDEMRKVVDDRETFGKGRKITEVKRAIPLTFSRKVKRDGTLKSRVCVQGFRLIKDVDYGDSYSPTIEWEAIRLIFAIGTSRMMRRHSCDFANAFCQTEMPENQRFYCRMPKRFRKYEEGVELVYPLNMSLYGTVQAALLWYENVSQWLMEHDFRRTEANPCVFVHTSGNMILTLYVDDVGIWECDAALYDKFKSELQADYAVEFKETMDEYLGANIEGDEKTVFVHIADYIDAAHDEFADAIRDANDNPKYKCDVRIPASKALTKLVEEALFGEPDGRLDAAGTTLFRSVIGKLMHAMVKTRVDIGFAVGLLARAQAQPTQALLHAALHIIKYLKATRRLGIKFTHDATHATVRDLFRSGTRLGSASDGDWGVRHSTSGFLTFLFGCLIGYGSKKQRSIALSSTEAEIFAASLAGLDLLYLIHLLEDLPIDVGTATLLVDNTGAKSILSNRTTSGHARHIERRYLHLREMRERKLVDIKFVPTEKNVADLLTKPLDAPRFEELRSSLLQKVP